MSDNKHFVGVGYSFLRRHDDFLVWTGFMEHQPLWLFNAKYIFIHMNSSILNNSV